MATMVGTQKELTSLLNALIELDLDAIEAYESAISRLDDLAAKEHFSLFKGDHERHVQDLRPLVAELGETPASEPDIKRVLTQGKVVLAALVGDKLILRAMKTNEVDTNTAYDRAVARDDLPEHVREVLLRNRDDERRHLAYIEKRIAEYEAEEGGAKSKPQSSAEPVPSSQAIR